MVNSKEETILVVEDDAAVARLEQLHLERAGYTVVMADEAEKAMDQIRHGGIDLVVLDYLLPGGSTGLDFYNNIKAAGMDLPVIIVTGYSKEETVIAALRAGVRDFITKSQQYLDYLPEVVERVLTQERMKRALVQSQDELKHSSSLLRSTLEATADGILVVDTRGQITDFNAHFVEMWRIPAEILESKDDERTIHHVSGQLKRPDEFIDKIKALYSQPTAQSKDILEFKDGRIFERFSQPQVLDGKPVGRVWSFRDITDQKKAEERLKESNKELNAFCYSVSHDLRAPLRGINGFSEVLLREYRDQLDERGQHYLRRVCVATQRMGQLIDDLLDLSRVTRHAMRYDTVQLTTLAHGIVRELRQTQAQRQVEFRIEEGLQAYGDTHLLQIALQNLLGNAWKFTSKHALAVIEFGLIHQSGEAVYFVRDDGAGFEMAYVHKLFDAFQRLHNETEFEGVGIGLATVQRIIRRHGGRVWAESAPERGATFYFTLPAQPALSYPTPRTQS